MLMTYFILFIVLFVILSGMAIIRFCVNYVVDKFRKDEPFFSKSLKAPPPPRPQVTPTVTPTIVKDSITIGAGTYASKEFPDVIISPFNVENGYVYYYDNTGKLNSLLVADFLVAYKPRLPTKISL